MIVQRVCRLLCNACAARAEKRQANNLLVFSNLADRASLKIWMMIRNLVCLQLSATSQQRRERASRKRVANSDIGLGINSEPELNYGVGVELPIDAATTLIFFIDQKQF